MAVQTITMRRLTQKKAETRLSVILLDQGLFTVYKRLFITTFALNVTALILAATGHFPYAEKETVLFSVGNILALVLCRSEVFLRILFWVAVKMLGRSWVPIPLKTAATSFLQCLGGIHSGCGISSIMWLIYSLVQILRHRESTSGVIISVAAAILELLFISSAAAFPLVRHVHHNFFEEIHRFAGWIALALLWAFVILTASYNPTKRAYKLRFLDLVKKQDFIFTLLITLLIIFPWLTVRKVAVQVSAPSGQASLIKFGGGVNPGLLGQISRSPLSDRHAFGIISDGKYENMMLAGAVGDFTTELVSDPPKFLYTRYIHFAGLPYLINMYEKVVVVATGSGIGVFLSFMLQCSRADVYFIWVAKAIQRNFGDEIVRKIESYPSEKMIVHDTAVSGHPNVAELTVKAVRDWSAQVVIVTSNPRGSRDVVKKCRREGIPAFGPIWDS
ncbi:adenylate-forming reductase 06235-like [Cryptomeria japonica]|uniref:adenylate-forming reductase 06235-like n=1 Tax=Cryptomeria japonica TaxID=3369 RepID=UPI0027DA79AE|nr:adenylate-forming reductase 06235-like [Cryptomeria japonica]